MNGAGLPGTSCRRPWGRAGDRQAFPRGARHLCPHGQPQGLQPGTSAPTILDVLVDNGIPVYSVGKIMDIFAAKGITEGIPTKNNHATVDGTIHHMRTKNESCLIFANCVDFDMLWGHRNNAQGYAQGLEEFDQRFQKCSGNCGPKMC